MLSVGILKTINSKFINAEINELELVKRIQNIILVMRTWVSE